VSLRVSETWQLSSDISPENTNFVYTVLKNKKRFEALRNFTLESGQEEIERRNRRRKEQSRDSDADSLLRANSIDSVQSPSSIHRRPSTLTNVPEEDGTFAIGDDDDDDTDDDHRTTPEESTPSERGSRAPSVSSTVDDAVPVQLRGMSEKARGKMPAGMPTFSRQNSTTSLGSYAATTMSLNGHFEPSPEWIESWLPELPLHTILTITDQLESVVLQANTTTDSPSASTLRDIYNAQIRGVDPSPIRIHSFEWSPLSLGWYESLLWGFIFVSEMQVAKGTVGVWNGTAIKLFRVQETAADGPTLTSPRGAVDAVGSNIVSRIGNMNLRANPLASADQPSGNRSGSR
jgi:hypothetical protein